MINYSLTINGVSYDCEVGVVISPDGTEAFDSGVIEIKNISKDSEFTEADTVIFTAGTKSWRLIVQADKVDRISSTVYDHYITLTEETAKLVKFYSGDRFYSLNGTSLFTHRQILEREIATTPLGSTTGKTFPYSVHADTLTALEINAPQKKFEGLDFYKKTEDIFRGIKAVARMENGVISHSYYNEFNNPITLSNLIGWQKNNDFNNYATNIVSRGRNLTYDLDETTGATWWPSKTEAATPRSSRGKYTDDEAQYQLGLDIRRTRQVFFISLPLREYPSNNPVTVDLDISRYVVSKEEWDGLPTGGNNFANIISLGNVVQRNSIYYTIGSNVIEGMAIEYKDSLTVTRTHLETLIETWIANEGSGGYVYVANDINDILMRVQYQPYVDATLSAEKWATDVTKVSQILNNQKDGTLDIGRYAPIMNTIANRLANGDWIVVLTHDDETEILELYDYTSDGYKVIKASYEFYPNQIIGTYQLSLRWATLNGYQSVYKSTDPYTIGRDNVESNFKYTEYLEFSTTNRGDTGSLTAQGKKTLWNVFDYASADDLQADVGIFNSSENTYDIAWDVMGTGGNGIRMISKFREPKNAGYELDRTAGAGDEASAPITYTDEAGYMASFQIDYCDDYTAPSGREDEFPKLGSPLTYTALASLPSLTVYKNPNEIFGLNYELLPCTDESDVIHVYNDFSKFNNLVNDGSVSLLSIYEYAGTVQFDEFDTVPKAGAGTFPIGDATVDKTLGYIDVSAPLTVGSTWAIGTADKLFMAVNYDGTDRHRIYINNLDERSTTEEL